MLSMQVREGLEAELAHLTHERQRLDDKIKAIQALLADEPKGQRSLPIVASGPLARLGLREAMKAVLSTHPSGLRTIELVSKLEQGGFSVSGKLPLSTRVYAEVGRLYKKEKRLRKGKGKRWIWPVEFVQATNTDSGEPNG